MEYIALTTSVQADNGRATIILTDLPSPVGAYRRLDRRDRILALATWLLLGPLRLMILVLPFSYLRRIVCSGYVQAGTVQEVDAQAETTARAISRAITRSARRTPWRSDCYPQALAACVLLRAHHVPHAIHFGVRRQGDLGAHAWVRAGHVVVSGAAGHEEFTVVGRFASSPHPGTRWRS